MGADRSAGVKVSGVSESNVPGRRVHDPSHPSADEQGYVTHSNVNADDPTGWKYMDLVNNGMPAFFHELSNTTMAMFRGLPSYESPKP